MKKVILVLATLAVLALVLSVCGPTPEPAEAGIPAFDSELTGADLPYQHAVYRLVDREMGAVCYIYFGVSMHCIPLSDLTGDDGR